MHGSQPSTFTQCSSWWVLWYWNFFKYAPLGTWRFMLLEYMILLSRHMSVGKSGSCRDDQSFGNRRLPYNSVVVCMSCHLMNIPLTNNFLVYRDNIITNFQMFYIIFSSTYITLTPYFSVFVSQNLFLASWPTFKRHQTKFNLRHGFHYQALLVHLQGNSLVSPYLSRSAYNYKGDCEYVLFECFWHANSPSLCKNQKWQNESLPFLLGISMLLFRHQYHVSVYAKLLIK
jgi:hypothetical protein